MQSVKIKISILIIFIALGKNLADGADPLNSTSEADNIGEEATANYICNPKLSHRYNVNNEDYLYEFSIEDEDRHLLRQPNEIEYLKFSNGILPFDHSTKLPSTYNWLYISIYAHKNTALLLIHVVTPKRRYFYSPNTKSKKWINHTIDKLSEYKEVDENGITYYKVKREDDMDKLNEDVFAECLRLSEDLHDNEISENSTNMNPNLEIKVKLTELLNKPERTIENEYIDRPKLELSSFKGEKNVRIQTYSLEVESPVARAILIHSNRCTFRSDFLNYNPKYFDNLTDPGLEQYKQYHLDTEEAKIKLKYKYGDELIRAGELKSMICGELKLEECTINIYKDGTDGWATTDRYVYEESFVQILNLNGVSVHGLDLRSHGSSDSPNLWRVGRVRAMLDDFDNMSKDLITFTKIVKEKYNDDLPIFLIGISMGAAVATRAIEICGNEKLVDGAILIATMMKFYEGIFNTIDNWARWILKAVALFNPKKQVASAERACETDYKSVLKTDDPQCPNNCTYFRTGFSLLRGSKDIIVDAKKINPEIRILLIHSTTDDVSFFEGTEEFFNALTQVKNKVFIRLSNIDHWATISHRYFTPIAKFIIEWIAHINKDQKIDHVALE